MFDIYITKLQSEDKFALSPFQSSITQDNCKETSANCDAKWNYSVGHLNSNVKKIGTLTI